MNLQQLRNIKNNGSTAKFEHMKEVVLKNSTAEEVFANINYIDKDPSPIEEAVANGVPKTKFKKYIVNHLHYYLIEEWYKEIISGPHK